MSNCPKYRLKKDTPAFRSGYVFTTDPEDDGILLDEEGISAFYKNEIDNFDEWFEEVPGEWPQKDDAFWSISSDGTSFTDIWGYNDYDKESMAIGNVFKTREAADRFANYLKAVATVSQDEGFMAPFGQLDKGRYGFGIFYDWAGNLCAEEKNHRVLAGEFYFDNKENAEKSIDSHPNEWKVILNYDWSRE